MRTDFCGFGPASAGLQLRAKSAGRTRIDSGTSRFCSIWARSSGPTAPTGRADFSEIDEPHSDHTSTGRRCDGLWLFESRPGTLYTPGRLLHVDRDIGDFVGGRFSRRNNWGLGIDLGAFSNTDFRRRSRTGRDGLWPRWRIHGLCCGALGRVFRQPASTCRYIRVTADCLANYSSPFAVISLLRCADDMHCCMGVM